MGVNRTEFKGAGVVHADKLASRSPWSVPAENLGTHVDPKKMPFDGKRLIYGGFKDFVSM